MFATWVAILSMRMRSLPNPFCCAGMLSVVQVRVMSEESMAKSAQASVTYVSETH